MTARKKVAVICGGESPEHEISCLSGLGIFAAIDKDKYEAILLGISDEGRRFIELKSREDFGSDENGLPVIPKNGVFRRFHPMLIFSFLFFTELMVRMVSFNVLQQSKDSITWDQESLPLKWQWTNPWQKKPFQRTVSSPLVV